MLEIPILFDGKIYRERDLGREVNGQLMRVYDHFTSAAPIDLSSFRNVVGQFLDKTKDDKDRYAAHDDYFEWFAPIWIKFMNQGHLRAAESVWQFALQPVLDWEGANNQHVHKGTAYYFWAGTVLLGGDIDRAFILMHRGFREDEVKAGSTIPDTPGNAFVTLDSEKLEQFFRPLVQETADFLDRYILQYKEHRMRPLTLAEFRRKFLSNRNLRPAALFFVYLIHKLRGFRSTISGGLAESDFAALLELDLLFGLCLVSDSVIKMALSNRKANFIDLATSLLAKLNFTMGQKQLRDINGQFVSNFGGAISALLGGTICGLTLQPLEIDIALTYGIRNRGAHNIEGHKTVFENFEEITQRLMNTLFVSVEVFC